VTSRSRSTPLATPSTVDMPMASAAKFCSLLEQSRLLSTDSLRRVREFFETGDDGEGIAKRIVEQGWLTRWQVQQLLAGRHKLFLGKYKLLENIGQGGMGAVFKAEHPGLGRVVALKVMAQELLKDSDAVARFVREIQSAAALDHPNIVAAYDADCVGDTYFLVMEYVEGNDLKAWIRQHQQLPIRWACEVVRQAALGLQHAHENGLVHRDIKPANLLIVENDGRETPQVKILDMGLARFVSDTQEDGGLTRTGQIMGTPDYIAPEQGEDTRGADIRADVFSLGCTLFHAVTGQLPFTGGNVMEKLLARVRKDAPPVSSLRPDVPAGLDAVVATMLARNPGERYQTPAELAAALAPFALGTMPQVTESTVMLQPEKRKDNTPAKVEARPDTTLNHFLHELDDQPANLPPTARPANSLTDHLADRRMQLWGGGTAAVLLVIFGAVFFGGGEPPDEEPSENKQQRHAESRTLRGRSGFTEPGSPSENDYDHLATGDWINVFDVQPPETDGEGIRYNDGVLVLTKTTVLLPYFGSRDIIVRAQVKKLSGQNATIRLRRWRSATGGLNQSSAWMNSPDWVGVGREVDGKYQGLEAKRLPQGTVAPDDEGFVEMTFAAVGKRLFLYLNGRKVIDVGDSTWSESMVSESMVKLEAIRGRSLFKNVQVMLFEKESNAGRPSPFLFNQRPKPVRTIPVAGRLGYPIAALNAPRVLALVGSLGPKPVAMIYDLHTGKEINRLTLTPIIPNKLEAASAFSANGKLAVFHIQNGEVWIWHVEKPGEPLKVRGRDKVSAVFNEPAVSFDSEQVAVRKDDTTIALLDAATGKERGVLQDVPQGTRRMAFSPDGRWLWTTGVHVAHRWNLQSLGKPESIPGYPRGVGGLTLATSPDGAYLAAGGGNKMLLYSVNEKNLIHTLKPHLGAFGQPRLGRDSAGRPILATTSGRVIHGKTSQHYLELWDVETGRRRMLVPFKPNQEPPVPRGFLRDKDGTMRLVMAARYAHEIEIWDIPPQPAKADGKSPRKNHALAFDGKDDYVVIPGLSLKKDTPVTIEAWVKLGDYQRAYPKVVVLSGLVQYSLGTKPGRIAIVARFEKNRKSVYPEIDLTVPRRRFVHLAGVWTGKEFNLFVDGRGKTSVGQRPMTPPPTSSLLGNHFRKRPPGQPSNAFIGEMREVRISKTVRYTKNFTPQTHFQPDKHTLALYHFDEGRGDVLKDSSGNGHHGKIHGATWVNADGPPSKPAAKSQP